MKFDAVLLVSFGGPEGVDDVMPFLQNVLRGRPVPPGRMQQVAAHYLEFGGVSPINGQNRALVEAIGRAFDERHHHLPIYWGNRNWHPYLDDAVRAMAADGIQRAAAFATSAYSSYSGCRQYVEDLARAREEAGPGGPELIKLRPYFNHPGFVEPLADGLRAARAAAGPDAPVLMSAHSIPVAMAATCGYQDQLNETARLVAERAGVARNQWRLVFQSRSGPPQQPWLAPDIDDHIRGLALALDGEPLSGSAPGRAPPKLIVVPIGFVSDHMEVVYDLDRTAAASAAARGIQLVRVATPGSDPRFAAMVCDLVEEAEGRRPPAVLGNLGPVTCPCLTGCRPGRP